MVARGPALNSTVSPALLLIDCLALTIVRSFMLKMNPGMSAWIKVEEVCRSFFNLCSHSLHRAFTLVSPFRIAASKLPKHELVPRTRSHQTNTTLLSMNCYLVLYLNMRKETIGCFWRRLFWSMLRLRLHLGVGVNNRDNQILSLG